MAPSDAQDLMLDFVSERTLPLLRTVVRSQPYAPTLDDSQADWYVVASFVAQAYERDADAFDALSAVVKGSMLMSATYGADIGKASQRFFNLTVVLDTPLLLRLLGLVSESQNEAAREFVALARKLGARVAYPDHEGRDDERAAELLFAAPVGSSSSGADKSGENGRGRVLPRTRHRSE